MSIVSMQNVMASISMHRSLKALVDAGDIIGAAGSVKRTEKGELSVVAASVQILTKSLQPLPDKWHGLADIEKRYRQRWGNALSKALAQSEQNLVCNEVP